MDEFLLIEGFLEDDDFNRNHALYGIIREVGDHHNLIGAARSIPVYNKNYFEEIVPRYSINDFKSHFRMSRVAFQKLCESIAPLQRRRHLFISLEKKVSFFIWIIAKQESFLATSDRFGFGKGTGYYIFKTILQSVTQLKEDFIKWPTATERSDIATRIEIKCGFPGVVGAIDGTHILIKQPTDNGVDFYNRKEQHSIVLQAVCDDKKKFCDVFIGMPGRLHDARVFRNSPLYQKLVNIPPLLPPFQHLLGDAAYPLMQNLLTPYRDNGQLTPMQLRYNTTLSGQRSVIERAYALLKGKWRRLKFLDMSLVHLIPEVVLAACVLHNFVLKTDIEDCCEDENDILQEHDVELEAEDNAPGGIDKRYYITSLL